MRNRMYPIKEDVIDLMLCMGHDKFFATIAEVANDNIKVIEEKYKDAIRSKSIWITVAEECNKLVKLFKS